MARKTKRIMKRILAVVMAVALIPLNAWGTAGVVMAEETSEVFVAEDADVDTEDMQKPQENGDEEEALEDSDVDNKADNPELVDGEDSAPVSDMNVSKEVQDVEVEPGKKESEKVSTETDNKDTPPHVHNFTSADGNYDGTSDDYFTLASSERSGVSELTYNGLTLKKAMKLTNSDGVTFTAPKDSIVVVVYTLQADQGGVKVDTVSKTVTKDTEVGGYVLSVTLDADGKHSVLRDKKDAYLYYISVTEPAGSQKQTVATPTANKATESEVKVDDIITLSCDTDDAAIYYKINNGGETVYSAAGITIADGMQDSDNKITITAYAKKDGWEDSDPLTVVYTLSTEAGENQLEMPEADPTSGEVPKGTEIQLTSKDNAPIYYTTDGTTTPSESSTLFKADEPIIIDKETTIKAIAIRDGSKSSFVATFTYTIKKPTIKVNDDDFSKSVIDSVTLGGDITFTNGTNEVFDISLKAEANTTLDNTNAVKTAAENIKENDGQIFYYDFSLINNEDTDKTVSIADGATGTLQIKMPYTIASDVSKRNKITVVSADAPNGIEPSKDSTGFTFDANSVGTYAVVINPADATGNLEIRESEGYEEGAYAEWKAVDDADGYMAYIASPGGKWERIDDELIREYADYWRVDTVGLARGTYYIKIDAISYNDAQNTTASVIATETTDPLTVTNYDRSGFAFSSKSPFKTGSGAYKEDGTLKDGAQVIYVTKDTAKTVALDVITNNKGGITSCNGLQSILDARQKGYDKTPLDIRVIGCVSKSDLDHISSDEEGLQIKGKGNYEEMNITMEGIGEDAVVNGFGFLIRNCGNVELRNFGILNFIDDGVSIDTANCNIWVHDLDIFYGSVGGDSDQAKGDGSVDIKGKSEFITVAYNHFWDSGKCSLCGMGDSEEFTVTYHHNWFDHSDSRHPRIRVGSIHVYNNYFDGNSKYGVGVTKGSSAFVEANYFRNCKYPMLISQQASDIAEGTGTFSGEDGGIIKAYNNAITGAKALVYANAANGSTAANATAFDAYLVMNRSDAVPSSVKTLKGGTSYNNFDTSSSYDLGVKEENIDTPENVPAVVTAKAGRLNGGDLKWNFDNDTEDTNYAVVGELKAAVVGYKTSIKKIGSGVAKDIKITQGGGSNVPSGDTQTVNPPTASKPSGEVEEGTEITLSSNNSGDVKIYYTLNGLDPIVKNEALYTSPIAITKETTIKAIAVVGTSQSAVATFKYTLPGGTTPTPTPTPTPGGDDDNQPARGTYTLDISEAYDAAVPNAADGESRTEIKGTSDFFALLFLGKTSNGKAGGSAIGEKSSNLEFEDGYQANRYFSTSGAAKTNQASVKIVTKAKTTVTVWWQPGGDTDLQQRQVTVLNSSGSTVDTSEVKNLETTKGYKTSFELANAGTYYIGSAKSSINIYKIEVKYEDNGGQGDATVVDPPTATPRSEDVKRGDKIELSAAGEIYYTMTIDGSEPATPPISSEKKYATPIEVTAQVGATVKIKAIAVVDGKSSTVASFTYNVVDDTPVVEEQLSKPEASPAPVDGKTYPVNVLISLRSKEGGTIYYTLDGSEPKTADGQPSATSKPLGDGESIKLETVKTHTIKAFAVKEGYLPSDTATYTYTVAENATETQLKQPAISPASKEVEKGEQVTVTITKAEDEQADAEIYYTTDGTTPSKTKGQLYTEPFTLTVNETTIVTAIVIKDGAISSPTDTVTYTVISEVREQLSKPEASPAPADGTYPVGVLISLTSQEGGTIHYTLDGSEPKRADGQPSETSKALGEDESIKLETVGTHTIKAFAVKEGYPSSDVATYTYTVAEDATQKQLTQPAITPASKNVEKGEQVTVTITKAADDPTDAEIYYTTDGTTPSKTKGQLYTEPFTLTVNGMTIVTAIVIKDGAISSPTASVTYTVNTSNTHKEGLWVELKDKDEYTYTGSAIKPEIVVGNYDNELVEGVDYTVAYKNNINAVTDATKDNKMPQIIVTGKGNLTGKATQTFTIKPRALADVVVAEAVKDGANNQLLVVKGTKPAPTLYYGGGKLAVKKDYTLSITDKCTEGDVGKDITITGTGNYTGELSYKLNVIAKEDLKKFAVALTDPNYTYDGNPKTLQSENVVVTDKADNTPLAVDTNYKIVYQNDITNAGKVKFTVVGLGLYSGAVTKTYTIKPLAETTGFAFTGVGASYPYSAAGVTIPTAGITYNGKTLEQGKDYKLAYGNNKKVGTTAKISATFMGNYKGSKIDPKEFAITQITGTELNNQTQGLKIAIADQVYKKPSVYKSVPYVSVNGVEVKSSEYVVKYYTSGTKGTDGTITVDTNTEMGSKNKIELSETEQSKPVYVEITGKGKNYADTVKLTASYNVCKASESAFDLSKAKLTVYKDWKFSEITDKTKDKANKTSKLEYTGVEIEPGVMIEFKDAAKTKLSPAAVKALIDAEKITVEYTNNVEKGKATIVINGNGTDYVGGKTVTFSITTKNLKNEAELLTNLFKNINDIIKG